MTSPNEIEWLIFIPDIGGTLEKRMSVRELHIKEIAKHIDSGLFQMGGATLHSPPKDGKLNISGSAIIARANSVEEVLEVLKQDIYYRSGVWDFDKIQIHPDDAV
ncbi:hypothetical protein EDB81DRAFT_948448 [Dactylonectria macrodidyma]|uniref:YCII-related domain-containing protein n=1 Tax=Dactylonectria macrodidyma TaxID=307937 RepID=A0A9P9ENZ8_9HYPO|nr:hypothetical protein EDB81DRAFT_948448 [Dactylonectria macrodidyma]